MEIEILKTKEKKQVPELRFGEFEEEWKKLRLHAVADKIQDGTHFSPKILENGNFKYITSKNIRNGYMDISKVSYLDDETHQNIYKRCNVRLNDVLLTKDGSATGTVCLNSLEEEFSLLSSVAFIRADESLAINEFIYYCIAGPKGQFEIRSSISGQAITRITLTKLKNFKFSYPSLPEQKKIAIFLSAVDKKIRQLSRKKELLEEYKKGVMQKLFSGQIRFKDVNGKEFPDWKARKLNYYLEVSKAKNLNLKYDKNDVLSVSGQYGIVNQIEFQGRSFAGESVHNYGVVEAGDIVYTKSPLKSNPYGIIKVNKGKSGIVSTLYAVYKCKPSLLGPYLDYYFQLDDNTNRYLRPLVQKGSKNDMKINNYKVLIDPVVFPTVEEQRKIIEYLEKLDAKIELANKKQILTKSFKKGLLQQMFV